MMMTKPGPPHTLSYLADLTDEGLMMEALSIHHGIDSVQAQLAKFHHAHDGTELTDTEADWLRRANKALELLRQKRHATDLLIRRRRLAGHLYPDAFVAAAEETLEDGTFERISDLAASRVLEAREQGERQRRKGMEDVAESAGNR